MNPTSPGLKLTYDDYLLFPEDGNRHELIDGEHYVTPPLRLNHQGISGNLHLVIASWLEEHPIGRIYYAPVGVVFSNFDVVEPTCSISPTRAWPKSPRRNTYRAHLNWSSKSDAQHAEARRDHQETAVRAMGSERVLGGRSRYGGCPRLSTRS